MFDVDLVTVGRVNLDLYAQPVGAPFDEATGFDAMPGGSPVNVAVAASRLGVAAGVFTAVGDDLVGDWVLRALAKEGIDTTYALRKPGPHTSLALRAQLPPDHPLVFYRHDPADIHLTVEDAARLPLARVRVLLVSGDALSRGTTAEACGAILARQRPPHTTVYLDLDLREATWSDLDAYAAAVGTAVEQADVVLGTEAEFAALLGTDPGAPEDALQRTIRARLSPGSGRVLILKQGARGATFFLGDDTCHVSARPVREASSVGAGDSFAGGLVHARLAGLDWLEAGLIASECAAITVSRYGCSRGFPHPDDLDRQAVVAGDR